MWKVVVAVFSAILGSIVIICLFFVLVTERSYRKIFYHRGDGAMSIDYAQFREFENLKRRKIAFRNNKKDKLIGYVYSKKNAKKFKALVAVSHGIGFGHSYLFNLINALCESRFLVFAFDMTGSGVSGGRYIKSLLQSIDDINAALSVTRSDIEMSKLPLYLFGHSWGAFASMNALHFEKNNIKKVVAVSGFNKETDLARGKGTSLKFAKFLMDVHNRIHFKNTAKLNSFDALNKTIAKVLYLQGEDDVIVNPDSSGHLFASIKRENIKVIMYPNKGHSPFVDSDAEVKAGEVLKDYGLFGEKEKTSNYKIVNYRELSKPDLKVYKTIIDFYLH